MSYIDRVPSEILTNLASILANDGATLIERNLFTIDKVPNYNNIIPFVKGDPQHCRAMLEALDYRLTLTEKEETSVTDIVPLFRELLREIDLMDFPKGKVPENIRFLPRIRKASMHCTPQQLKAISGMDSLTDLTVLADHDASPVHLVKALKSLPLIKFGLHIYLERQHCRLKAAHWQKEVAKACPNVKEFRFKNNLQAVTSYWTLIVGIKSLEILDIEYCRPDRELIIPNRLPFLRSLKVLHLNMATEIRQAIQIGKVLTSIVQTEPCTTEDIAKLIAFPSLRLVGLALQNGVAKALLDIPVHSVEKLSLKWYYTCDLSETDGNAVLEIVKKAKKLRQLFLFQSCINFGTMVEILKRVGLRLETLVFHFPDNCEYNATKVAVLLETVARYCRNVQAIVLLKRKEIYTTQTGRNRCLDALKKVKRLCPNFLSYDRERRFLESHIVSVE